MRACECVCAHARVRVRARKRQAAREPERAPPRHGVHGPARVRTTTHTRDHGADSDSGLTRTAGPSSTRRHMITHNHAHARRQTNEQTNEQTNKLVCLHICTHTHHTCAAGRKARIAGGQRAGSAQKPGGPEGHEPAVAQAGGCDQDGDNSDRDDSDRDDSDRDDSDRDDSGDPAGTATRRLRWR